MAWRQMFQARQLHRAGADIVMSNLKLLYLGLGTNIFFSSLGPGDSHATIGAIGMESCFFQTNSLFFSLSCDLARTAGCQIC